MAREHSSAELMTIGEVAERTGVAVSALRFYDAEGFITSVRTAGGQRRFSREVLRRIAFIRVAQTVGLTLEEIRDALATLPEAGHRPRPIGLASRGRGGRGSTRRSR